MVIGWLGWSGFVFFLSIFYKLIVRQTALFVVVDYFVGYCLELRF